MRREALLLIAAGCNQIYGLDPTTVRDLEPPACSTVQFSSPVELAQFKNGDREFDAQLSTDGRELWFVSNTAGTNQRYLMFRGARASDSGDFSVSLVDLASRNDTGQGEPALTADGLRLMFRVQDSPSLLFEGIRDDPHEFPFDSVVLVNGFSHLDFGIGSFDLSWDGLRIYYIDDGDVWMARRADRNQPFSEHRLVTEAQADFLTISGDELEIFYTRYGEGGEEHAMYRRARPAIDQPFDPEMLVLDEGGDPDISPTSNTLIVSRVGGLSIMNRRCDEN